MKKLFVALRGVACIAAGAWLWQFSGFASGLLILYGLIWLDDEWPTEA